MVQCYSLFTSSAIDRTVFTIQCPRDDRAEQQVLLCLPDFKEDIRSDVTLELCVVLCYVPVVYGVWTIAAEANFQASKCLLVIYNL